MTALSVTVSGESPAEVVAFRLRGLADALAPPSASAPTATTDASGGQPPVQSSPAPRLCSVHGIPLALDSWTSKAGKACKAWRCPQSTPESGCPIEWAS